MEERWLAVPGYAGIYEVSNLGRVRSLSRLDTAGRKRKGSIMRIHRTASGHQAISLYRESQKGFRIHDLVLRAFVGEPPAGMCAVHRDGNTLNNNLENLAWGRDRVRREVQVKSSGGVRGWGGWR